MTSMLPALSRALPELRASADEADRLFYARDLWPRHHLDVRAGRRPEHKPDVIVWPESASELAALVLWARRERVALVPFGAGSGVCAGILPHASAVVVDMKRMSRIVAIDRDAPLVDVQAGHMGVPLEQALNRAGFTLGHFPSSILCSTVGGWIATRSAGQCSGAYGKIEDMVVELECVTGDGEIVVLRRRRSGPDLVPLLVGSEGTLGVVTRAKLRLHPAPQSRAFGAWSFPTTRHGWEAMRALFQSGLRPAVARLYDPFDAMMAKRGSVRPGESAKDAKPTPAPGLGGAALRAILRRPALINGLLDSSAAGRLLGGAMLMVIFDEAPGAPGRGGKGVDEARRIAESMEGRWEGEGPARRWLQHRYSVSYRQAPVFANGAFVDTMEVAAPWSKLGDVYDAVRHALGEHVFVMAHFGHAYPDGCCIYFSFVGTADPDAPRGVDWDQACATRYDRAWRAALDAAVRAGGTLAHHHGVGRSKAPRLRDAMGAGVDVVRALMRAFDPGGLMNPGNLVPEADASSAAPAEASAGGDEIDRESLLVSVSGGTDLAALEARLNEADLTLDVRFGSPAPTVADWLARGAPGSRDPWQDPADQILAGVEATLIDGRRLRIPPAPRRSVGPDLTALLIGAEGRFGRVDRCWLRVHPRGVLRPTSAPFHCDTDPPVGAGEQELLDRIAREL
jgi:alkyldihydroxyacetonephosphate synthase